MLLQLVCGALALSQVVSGRGPLRARPPREDDGPDGLSNLQMLIPLLIEDSQAEQARAPPAFRSAPLYTDGSYSDIPAEAFLMEPFKASEKHTSTIKKDLGQFRAVDSPSPPDAVVAGCVRYFQGRSAATSHSTEALLQLCTEILDDADVEDVVHIHSDEGPCACCAAEAPAPPPVQPAATPPRPRAEEAQGAEALGSLVQTLMKLFSAGGDNRRRWLIMNSNHPDPQMRQYVDVEM